MQTESLLARICGWWETDDFTMDTFLAPAVPLSCCSVSSPSYPRISARRAIHDTRKEERMEKGATCRELARMTGYSEEFIRSACHRIPTRHPLPHVRSGKVRPVIRIRPSVFERWLEEEETTCTK